MLKLLKKFINYYLPISLVLINFLFSAQLVNASAAEIQSQLDRTTFKAWGTIGSVETLPGIIQVIISAFLGLLGIIFIILIIYSGFHWMTARGDEQKVTLAKETLTRAVIGLIIIVAAYSITYFVFNSLPDAGGGTSTTPTGP